VNDTYDLIRDAEQVKRTEQQIRDEAAAYADPIEFTFTERGRHLYARLASDRVREALRLRAEATS
jgi:hypothetical protein